MHRAMATSSGRYVGRSMWYGYNGARLPVSSHWRMQLVAASGDRRSIDPPCVCHPTLEDGVFKTVFHDRPHVREVESAYHRDGSGVADVDLRAGWVDVTRLVKMFHQPAERLSGHAASPV